MMEKLEKGEFDGLTDNDFTSMGSRVDHRVSRYGQPDVIWTHPETGGKVYVGCHTSASNLQTLEQHQINHIVNTQGMDSENYHEKDPNFTYLRFSIGNHYTSPFDLSTNEGILRFLNPLFNFLE